MNRFMLPDLGEGLEDAQVVSWHVNKGQAVVAGEPLVSVETAKAIVDIPVPVSGVIEALGAEPGDNVLVGALLVEISESDDDATTTKPYTGIVGDIPGASQTIPDSAPIQLPGHEQQATGNPSDILATPRVRAMAAERGIDLSDIEGSGPDGSVSIEDIPQVPTSESPAQTVTADARSVSSRKRMATIMQNSGERVVAATVNDVADVHDWPERTDTTIRLIEAIAHACQVESSLNAFFDDKPCIREIKTSVDLGIAVDAPTGLFVPVLRNIDGQAVVERRKELDQLVSAARNGTIHASQMTGATITLSNFGNLGGRFATLVVVPPQVAIVGTGKIHPAVVPVANGIGVRRMLPVSLTFDHRAVTGGEAVRFLNAFVASLENHHEPC